MIEDVAARVPASLSAYRNSVVADSGRATALPLPALHDEAVFDATLAPFAAGFGEADRRAVVSLWSQYYFALLATPALTALMRCGRPLPLAFEATRLELDAEGRPARLLIDAGEAEGASSPPTGLNGLIEGHLRPFIALCHARCGVAPRVLWGNAATILDYVAREIGGGEPSACDEVASCLGWRPGSGCARTPLAQALCSDASGCLRRACCLRHRLPGVASCGPRCPLERQTGRCPAPC